MPGELQLAAQLGVGRDTVKEATFVEGGTIGPAK
jgi:hypothetical protein